MATLDRSEGTGDNSSPPQKSAWTINTHVIFLPPLPWGYLEMEADKLSNQAVPTAVSVGECNNLKTKTLPNSVSSSSMASNSFSALTASYSKYGSEEQLVRDDFDDNETEDDEDHIEEEEYVQISGTKHLHFVTDSQLSSWSDPSRLFESTTRIG